MFDSDRQQIESPDRDDSDSYAADTFAHDLDVDLHGIVQTTPWIGLMKYSTRVGFRRLQRSEYGPVWLSEMPLSGDVEDITAGEPASLSCPF